VFVRASDYKYANALAARQSILIKHQRKVKSLIRSVQVSSNSQELLKSFDLLPDIEKREVASEIIRRAFFIDQKVAVDEKQLGALYASFAQEDRNLAEEGMEDYEEGLTTEDIP